MYTERSKIANVRRLFTENVLVFRFLLHYMSVKVCLKKRVFTTAFPRDHHG